MESAVDESQRRLESARQSAGILAGISGARGQDVCACTIPDSGGAPAALRRCSAARAPAAARRACHVSDGGVGDGSVGGGGGGMRAGFCQRRRAASSAAASCARRSAAAAAICASRAFRRDATHSRSRSRSRSRLSPARSSSARSRSRAPTRRSAVSSAAARRRSTRRTAVAHTRQCRGRAEVPAVLLSWRQGGGKVELARSAAASSSRACAAHAVTLAARGRWPEMKKVAPCNPTITVTKAVLFFY